MRLTHRAAVVQEVQRPAEEWILENQMPPHVVDDLQSLKNLVGQEIGVTDWFVVAQERIAQFAAATEDRQWIHVDRERAKKESPYGATVAHGFLTLALLSQLMKQALRFRKGPRLAVNYGL